MLITAELCMMSRKRDRVRADIHHKAVKTRNKPPSVPLCSDSHIPEHFLCLRGVPLYPASFSHTTR